MTTKSAPKTEQKDPKKEVITMRDLLECGVHFGHQTKRWNSKMAKYIFTSRNDIHVIDLQQTMKLIKVAYRFIKELTAQNGKVLFIGTKKQAQEAIESEAKRCNMYWVNKRWLGGTLTNHVTLRQSINNMNDLISQRDQGILDHLSKKEASKKTKSLSRLEHYLSGIKDMVGLPDAVFIIDTQKEVLAVREANKLGIPIIGVVDTNADPTLIDYPIPANDDAIRAINLIASVMSNAALQGQADYIKQSVKVKPAAKAPTTSQPAETDSVASESTTN